MFKIFWIYGISRNIIIVHRYIETKLPRRALDPILSCLPTYLPSLPSSSPTYPFPCPSCLPRGGVVYSVSFIDAHHVRERGLRDWSGTQHHLWGKVSGPFRLSKMTCFIGLFCLRSIWLDGFRGFQFSVRFLWHFFVFFSKVAVVRVWVSFFVEFFPLPKSVFFRRF